MKPISTEGTDFLKAATAAPDFQSLENRGVPDSFSGKSITKREFSVTTVNAAPGSTWYIVTPSSGVSYWTATNSVPGLGVGSVLSPILHPTANQLYSWIENATEEDFPGTNSSVVTDFRLTSMSAELACTTNAFNQYGSITCYKAPFKTKIISRESHITPNAVDDQYTDDLVMEGCQCLVDPTTSSDAYVAAVKDGAYAVSMNREAEFNWDTVRDGECLASQHSGFFELGTPSAANRLKWTGPLVAHDNNYDSIVFRVDVPPGVVDQSFVFKVWKTFEFQPTFNSLLYEVAHSAPMEDQASLEFYRQLERELPIAVPIRDNPDFWDILLQGIDITSELASALPGPLGGVASGVHAVTQALTKRKKPKQRAARTQPRITNTTPKKGANVRRRRARRRRR
jgi:hypothetical protein